MGKRNPGYYTPNQGSQADRIHRALAAINAANSNRGATAEEIAERSAETRTRVRHEMSWGKQRRKHYEDLAVIDQREVSGAQRHWHTDRYDPDRVHVRGTKG